MRLKMRQKAARLVLLPLLLAASGCATVAGSFPPRADLIAATEPKPIPGNEIVTDPVAEAKYNAAVESWGDRVRAAGVRLCVFFEDMDMPRLNCPKD